MTRKNIAQFFSLSVLLLSSSGFAAATNFNCPDPSAIQSTDFTSPSVWIAPPVPHSVPRQVGAGLGGKTVGVFLGAEKATIHNKKGWVCVYRSSEVLSTRAYEAKILSIVEGNAYLHRYLAKVNRAFQDAEPYLSKYPQDDAIGFVGYERQGKK